MYLEGGFFSISINQLCFDMIRKEGISLSIINGLIFNNVEDILSKRD